MLRFPLWAAVGLLFMVGSIAPVGKVLWIAAAVLAAVLIAAGARSPRFFFPFVSGMGLTLIGLGIVNTDYVFLILYGSVLLAAGIVGFLAFGPRTSHAEAP